MYIRIFILGIYMHMKKVNECAVASERSVFRIANSNVMSTLRGFR